MFPLTCGLNLKWPTRTDRPNGTSRVVHCGEGNSGSEEGREKTENCQQEEEQKTQ